MWRSVSWCALGLGAVLFGGSAWAGDSRPSGVAAADASPARALLAPGQVTIFGDVHGTDQLPAFVLGMVRRALGEHRPVTIGLEVPRGERERVERFWKSGQLTDLTQGSVFWTRQYQDGRSSHAMAELLRTVGTLRAAHADLELLLFDVDTHVEDRDLEMAKAIADAVHAAPARVFVVMVGNIHARRRIGVPRPMAWRLLQLGVPVLTLNVASSGGEAWMCLGGSFADCHAQPEGAAGSAPATPESDPVQLGGENSAYDGTYFVGRLTASAPAVLPDAPPAAR